MKSIVLACLFALTLNWGFSQKVVWRSLAHPDSLQTNGIAFSSDGSQIVAGTNCHPAKIRRFNTSNGDLTWDYTVAEALECVMSIGFSSNGQYLASSQETGDLLIFDYTKPTPDSILRIDLGSIYAFGLDFNSSGDNIFIGTSGGKLMQYEMGSGNKIKEWVAHSGYTMAVNFIKETEQIITGGSDKRVKLWNTSGTLIWQASAHKMQVNSVGYLPTKKLVYSCSNDGYVKIYSALDGTIIKDIKVSENEVSQVKHSPDERFLAIASNDNQIQVLDLATYSIINSFGVKDAGSALCLAWTKDGKHLTAGYLNSEVVYYDMESLTNGIVEMMPNSIIAFPNPFQNFIQLNSAAPVRVLNSIGQEISLDIATGNRINTEKWENGVYFLIQGNKQAKLVKR